MTCNQIQTDADRALTEMSLLQKRVDEHDTLIRRLSKCLLPREGPLSPPLSCQEIANDILAAGRRGWEYVDPRKGGRAAHEAQYFFDRKHVLMGATVVLGMLFSPSGAAILQKEDGQPPARDPEALVAMRRPYVLRDGCIWQLEEGGVVLPPDANLTGFKHYVTMVSTLEGERVAVDWSLGQYTEMPADLRLYLAV